MNKTGFFFTAIKSVSFAWNTNAKLFLLIIFFSIFQGSIVYVQFTTFASIINVIVTIKQGFGKRTDLVEPSIILGLSFLLPTVAGHLIIYYKNKFRLQQGIQLHLHKIKKQASLDIGTIESSSYQNLLQYVKEWGSSSVSTLQEFIFISTSSVISILASVGILWSLNKWLVLFAVLAALPIYFLYKKYGIEVFRIRKFSSKDYRIIANRISHFEEIHKAVDVVLLRLKDWLKEQILDRMVRLNEKVMKAEAKKTVSLTLLSFWYLIFLFLTIALITYETLLGSIAIGGLFLAFTSYTKLFQTINGFVESISHAEEAGRYAAYWFELLALKPRVTSSLNSVAFKSEIPPLIEFRNVSFRYPGMPSTESFVLKQLSFSIKPREKVAIVGANGSGKTTLIKLLCRVYDPTEGCICIDGKDMRDIRLEDWQKAIGVLFQDFPIYNLTIRESIGIGRIPDTYPHLYDAEKVRRAAEASGADEFISDYDQLIWKDFPSGIDLSKGQHQRLSVARMFYRDALVTIFDEPTASIDTMAEEKIFNTLEKNMDNKTVILITHRLNSLKNSNNILMFEKGRIIEQGHHKELMSLNGKYAKLYTAQAKRYAE